MAYLGAEVEEKVYLADPALKRTHMMLFKLTRFACKTWLWGADVSVGGFF